MESEENMGNNISINMNVRYDEFLLSIRRKFYESTKLRDPIFKTNVVNLYDLFLRNIPEDYQQEYNCHCCRKFMNSYGGLVRVDRATGELKSVMWGLDDTPPFYQIAVEKIKKAVENSKIIGIFKTEKTWLGVPATGNYKHLAVEVPEQIRCRYFFRTERKVAAEVKENFLLLVNAVKSYSIEEAKTALNLLNSGSFYGSERVIGNIKWLLDVLQTVSQNKRNRNNILWFKAATAPAGYCHITSNMLGALLDDIHSGLPLYSIKSKFSEKMNPLRYMRPQAAPSIGNVERAEQVVSELGIANSLKRRYARVEELQTIWKPVAESSPANGGIFSYLVTKSKTKMEYVPDAKDITWEKFRRDILPTAKKIEFYVPSSYTSYGAIITAEDFEAPPIIQWDSMSNRNPFSWYVYSGGSNASQWGLPTFDYVKVTAITLKPNMWQDGFEHHGRGVFFILEGSKDSRHESIGLGLFPALLKSELHEIRSTIEAYSNSNSISGCEEASACGILLNEGPIKWKDAVFRVTSDFGKTIYVLDRWE